MQHQQWHTTEASKVQPRDERDFSNKMMYKHMLYMASQMSKI